MDLYTLQLGKWRLAKARDIVTLDTTVRTGVQAFAPSWDMVMGHKAGTLSDAEYRARYRTLMLDSVRQHARLWRETAATPALALMCYCPAGTFCHRHLLAGYLEEYCHNTHRPITLMGELTHES